MFVFNKKMKDVIMNQDVIIENQIDEFKVTYVSNDEKRKNLEKAILDFFISNEVIAEETIYQSDSVNEKCQELVEELYGIINFDVQCENL